MPRDVRRQPVGCLVTTLAVLFETLHHDPVEVATDQPDLEAVVRTTLGEVQSDLGQYADAEASFKKVLAIRRKLYGNLHPDVASSLVNLVDLLRAEDKRSEAEGLAREAIAIDEHLVQHDPQRQEYRQDLGHSQWRFGYVLGETDRHQAAVEVIQQALETFEKAANDFPENAYFRQEQAFSHRTLGDLLRELGRAEEADQHDRIAIKIYGALKAAAPESAFYYAEEAYTTWMLATKLEHAGRLDAAAAEYRRAITLHEQAIAKFPSYADLESRRESARNNLVSLLNSQGKQAEAETILREQSPASRVRRSAKHATDEILPIIVMDDVPLTVAIRNLARQANLSFTFEPGVTNQIRRADGQKVPEPTVNIRWENLTVQQALDRLLSDHGLAMEEDPQTQLARITVADPETSTEKVASAMRLVGKSMPWVFELPLLAGGKIELPPATNHGPLLLDFFASWCGPCREAMPVLAGIAKDYSGRGVRYVAVNQGEAPEAIRRYLTGAGLQVSVALDSKCGMAGAFRVRSIPTIVIVDRADIIRDVHVGTSPKLDGELRAVLDKVLREQPEQGKSPENDSQPEN